MSAAALIELPVHEDKGFSSCSRPPTGQHVITLQEEKLQGRSLLRSRRFYSKFRYQMPMSGCAPAHRVPKPLTAGSCEVMMHDMFFCWCPSLQPSAAACGRNRLD